MFIQLVKDQLLLARTKALLDQLKDKESQNLKLTVADIMAFYEVAYESCKLIEWNSQNLSISKYMSSLMGNLLQISEGQQKLSIFDRSRKFLL